jgi:hypothetical protein
MNISPMRRLMLLPLLASATTAYASPILLAGSDMDRITAGTLPVFQQVSNLLTSLPQLHIDLLANGWKPFTTADLSLLAPFTITEPLNFVRDGLGSLVANYILDNGQKLVLVRPDNGATTQATTMSDGTVKTWFLQPGESLSLNQSSSGGTNYLFVRSTGSSTVTTFQSKL